MFKLLGLSVAAVLLVPSAAFASPLSVTRSQHVSYADLDLTTVTGQSQFRKRLSAAARNVCRNDDEESFTSQDIQDCQLATWQRAFRQFKVARDYAMRTGNAPTVLATR